MNKIFDVLDCKTNIWNHHLLEASAGTGKTFAIENIVVRLLLEKEIDIEKILIVTFTRLATQDLKLRIRENIEKAIFVFNEHLKGNKITNHYEYLQPYLNENKSRKAKRALERALASYDSAQIFTIHAFCQKMLSENPFESNTHLKINEIENALQMTTIIKDFFRTDLKSCTPYQLEILLKKNQNDENKLAQTILNLITCGKKIIPPKTLKEQLSVITKLKKGITNDIKNKLMQASKLYNKTSDRQGNLHEEIKEQVNNFSNVLSIANWKTKEIDIFLESGRSILNFTEPKNQKKKTKGQNELLNFIYELRNSIKPIIKEETDYSNLLCKISYECQPTLKKFLHKEAIFLPDDLLTKMVQSCNNKNFVSKIQMRYKIAIVDEFQDTDPLQWDIFQTIFLAPDNSWKGFVYLVGDPKQSIYAFRNADIYTYLQAENHIGTNNKFSLNTNYRSKKTLVDIINILFNKAKEPFPLPKSNKSLNYASVETTKEKGGALHFFTTNNKNKKLEEIENQLFFPYITNEIINLTELNIPLKEIAILVRDRFQGRRLKHFLDKHNVPSEITKNKSITKSTIWNALKEIIKAIINPQDKSALNAALMGNIMQWSLEDAQEKKEYAITLFLTLKKEWAQFGFFYSLKKLLQCDSTPSMEQNLKQEMTQIVELLIQSEHNDNLLPEQLLEAMQKIELSISDEELLIKQENENAIKILTLHACKGLEFKAVFALGLINRTPKTKNIISNKNTLKAYDENSSEYQQFCNEIDAEKMRQLYVAITRAKEYLYLPIIFNEKETRPGQESPMEIFLKKLLNECSYNALKTFIQENCNLENINCCLLEKQPKIAFNKTSQKIKPIKKSKLFFIPRQKITINSFSSLTRLSHKFSQNKTIEIPENIIPPSKETGVIIHEILQNIAFSTTKNNAICFVEKYLKNTFLEKWSKEIGSMIYNTLNKQLSIGNKIFCLSSIKQCFREIEFLLREKNGFITGIIDLVFYYDGLYYIVDWKTNYLPSYSQKAMQLAMDENNYHLQTSIYKKALKKYLQKIEKEPLEKCFGGSIYIFLRGINKDNQDGIYYAK